MTFKELSLKQFKDYYPLDDCPLDNCPSWTITPRIIASWIITPQTMTPEKLPQTIGTEIIAPRQLPQGSYDDDMPVDHFDITVSA